MNNFNNLPDSQAVRDLIGERKFEEARLLCMKRAGGNVDTETLHFLGYIDQQTGKYRSAVKNLSRAKKLGLMDWSAELTLAYCHQSLKQHRKAELAARRALGHNRTSIEAADFIVESLIARARFKEAKRFIKEIDDDFNDDQIVVLKSKFPVVAAELLESSLNNFTKLVYNELLANRNNRYTDNLSLDIDDYNTIKYEYENIDRLT